MKEKPCSKCNKVLPLSAFSKDSTKKIGVRSACRWCLSDQYKDNYEHHSRVKRKHALNKKYGITVEEYAEMEERQKGVCFICKKQETKGRKLAVDHCHSSGKVRALLCGNCNRGLGRFKDNTELLKRAVSYLEEHE